MERIKLGEICEIVSGSTPKTSVDEYWDGDIDWITPAELKDETYIIQESQRKITHIAVQKTGLKPFPKGTVILSSRAPIGKVALAGKEMYCNQGFKNLICSDRIDSRYLYWYLKGHTDYLNSLGRGATFKEISKTIVENIEIPLPDLNKQVNYANTLKKCWDLLSVLKEKAGIYDNLIKSRFVEMFGIPGSNEKGWGVSMLGKCCVLNPKKGEDKRLRSGMKVSFIPMSAITENGNIDVFETKLYDEVKTGFTYFSENDVLFAKITPCMENGKGAVAAGLCNGVGFGSTEFHVIRPVENVSNPYWLYHLMSFNTFRNDAAANMTGSAGQRRVPVTFLENYKISLPPIHLQNEFAAFVRQVDKLKFETQKSLKETQTLMDSLMQEYFG